VSPQSRSESPWHYEIRVRGTLRRRRRAGASRPAGARSGRPGCSLGPGNSYSGSESKPPEFKNGTPAPWPRHAASAKRAVHILHIESVLHILHILHIILHILHIPVKMHEYEQNLHIAAYFIAYFFAYRIKLHILHIMHIKSHIIHIVLHIILHILPTDFIYILCILCI
jgi:hypothetical protein